MIPVRLHCRCILRFPAGFQVSCPYSVEIPRFELGQREQLKVELAELEKRKRDIFWDVEYAMLSTGIKYFNTCSEYWLYKVESEYIKAEKEYLAKQTDI